MQYARSVLFTAYMMASACLFGALMALCFWLPYRAHFAMARAWARLLFRVLARLCGLRFTVHGRENIPAGNHIVMSNHTSAWETVAPFVLFPPQVWVLKRELLWIPFVGWGLKLLKPIAINRGEAHRAVNQVLEQGSQRLADGLWVVIFPEGTRVTSGETKRFGVSGALLAASTGKLVVPMAHDAGRYWRRRGIMKKAGTIHVVIGTPIESQGKSPRDLNEEVRRSIEASLARIAALETA
jgi:1-acyl-sn-glycerol-3-phosphate acyltransferase